MVSPTRGSSRSPRRRTRRTSRCTGAPTATTCATSRRTTGRAGSWQRSATSSAARVDALLAAGIRPERIILDPGLGFAKRAEHNWELLAHLDRLAALGYPLLVGASRKSFLGRLLADEPGAPRPVDEREAANVALTTVLARARVWGIRVHDVRSSRDALRVVARLEQEEAR